MTYCPAVEVFLDGKNECLVLRNSLALVAPFPCNLDRRLDSFCTSVHGQDHLKAKHLGDGLGEFWKDIVVKSPRAESESRGLVDECLYEFRVTVTLVDGAVSGQEVKVMLSFWIPDGAAESLAEDNRKRVVVVSGVLGLG